MSEVPRLEQETVLRVFLFTDIVGSTDLKQRLGDADAAALMGEHDRLFRSLLAEHGGVEEDDTGDGFFATFERPSEAVRCALAFQQRLAAPEDSEKLTVRVGIHMGEIIRRAEDADGSRAKLVGLAVDTAARVMGAGGGGQIIVTRGAFDSARQQIKTAPDGSALEWLAHGPYLLKGVEEPLDLFEVGLPGLSLLAPPKDSEKVKRGVALGDEITLGWRPAAGLTIPHRSQWTLIEQIGEGGFGEVWIAEHAKMRELRVFKFCFQADRLRGLKREIVVFRLLKETLGDRDDIARILDWQFDSAPFFIESDYTRGGSLIDWADAQGGIDKVPLETRLNIVAQVATALAAAHSVGVLHKDIKPANILIEPRGAGQPPQARLTDFGIGLITDRELLDRKGITATGLTEVASSTGLSSGSGTRLYLAPELIEGKPATTLSDIFALGVLLYQLVCADLARALAPGWERDVEEELLREDISACVDRASDRRLGDAQEIAHRLRGYDTRRAELGRLKQRAVRARRRKRALYGAGILLASVLIGISLVVLQQQRLLDLTERERDRATTAEREMGVALSRAEIARTKEELARAEAERAELRTADALERAEYEQYVFSIQLAAARIEDNQFDQAKAALLSTAQRLRNWEWGYLMRRAHPELSNRGALMNALLAQGKSTLTKWHGSGGRLVTTFYGHDSAVLFAEFDSSGRRVLTVSADGVAKIWEAASGRELVSLDSEGHHITSARFGGDGSSVVTASAGGTARIWDSDTGATLFDLPGGETHLNTVALNGSESHVVAGDVEGSVFVWEIASRKLIRKIKAHDGEVLSIQFAPDGESFVSSGRDQIAKRWSLPSGDNQAIYAGHTSEVRYVDLDSAATRVVTTTQDQGPRILDFSDAREIVQLYGHGAEVRSCVFSADGTALVTASDDRTAIVWDAESGLGLTELEGHTAPVHHASFSPDGEIIVTASADGTAKVWQVVGGQTATRLIGHGDIVVFAELDADGGRVVTASHDKTARVWDAKTGKRLLTLEGHDDLVKEARFSPDGTTIVTASWDRTAKVWDSVDGRLLHTLGPQGDVVFTAQFSPGGDRIGTFSWDLSFRLWDAASGEEVMRFETPATEFLIVGPDNAQIQTYGFDVFQFGPKGALMAAGSFDSVAKLYDLRTGETLHEFAGHDVLAWGSQINSTATRVATVPVLGPPRVWDALNGEELLALPTKGQTIAARFGPAGRRILTVNLTNNEPALWDAETGELVRVLVGHVGPIRDTDFIPDGSRIVTASLDHTVRLWDSDGRFLLTLGGHSAEIATVRFSSDGSQLVTASLDRTARIWEAILWSDLVELGDPDEGFDALFGRWRLRQSR